MSLENIVGRSDKLRQRLGSVRKLATLTEPYPADLHPKRDASADSIVPDIFPLMSLESTLPRNRTLTPLQSTLTKTLDLKSIRMNTYKKTGGEGCRIRFLELQRASAPRLSIGDGLELAVPAHFKIGPISMLESQTES
jgi:hypothetical protein